MGWGGGEEVCIFLPGIRAFVCKNKPDHIRLSVAQQYGVYWKDHHGDRELVPVFKKDTVIKSSQGFIYRIKNEKKEKKKKALFQFPRLANLLPASRPGRPESILLVPFSWPPVGLPLSLGPELKCHHIRAFTPFSDLGKADFSSVCLHDALCFSLATLLTFAMSK